MFTGESRCWTICSGISREADSRRQMLLLDYKHNSRRDDRTAFYIFHATSATTTIVYFLLSSVSRNERGSDRKDARWSGRSSQNQVGKTCALRRGRGEFVNQISHNLHHWQLKLILISADLCTRGLVFEFKLHCSIISSLKVSTGTRRPVWKVSAMTWPENCGEGKKNAVSRPARLESHYSAVGLRPADLRSQDVSNG